MKRIFCICAAMALSACDSSAPTAAANGAATAPTPAVQAAAPAAAPANPAADQAALIQLEQDYAKALIAKDRAFLMRFYAPDWRGGNWMGFWGKATMLKSVLNDDRYVVKSMTVRDLKVRVIGDTAVVQGVDDEVTSVDGKDTSGKWAFTDVFERRDGRWVAVAGHTSKIEPSAAQ